MKSFRRKNGLPLRAKALLAMTDLSDYTVRIKINPAQFIFMREPVVYIMANKKHGTLYTGVTSDIGRRAYEHREGLVGGFTTRHKCKLLVWFEFHEDMFSAIEREKQIKAGSRRDKINLIEALNPDWSDLFETLA